MKVIFFGLGSIGLRHAAILKKNKNFKLYAYRTHKGQVKNNLGIAEVNRWKDIDRLSPDVAFITNPTHLHIDTAIECARRGMHLFIEKPLGDRTEKLNQLLDIVSKKKITTYVAYVLRFHPVINEVRKYVMKNRFFHMRIQTTSFLHRWRPGTDTRKSYSAYRNMGGGVILDLSHEIDYVRYILGDIKTIGGGFGRQSSLTVDAEDYADVLLKTDKGPANIHINFFSQMTERVIRVDFKEKAIEGDLIHSTLTEYKAGKPTAVRKFKIMLQDCYAIQLKYFFDNIGNPKMMNNVFESAPLFKKIIKFRNFKYA